MNGGGGTVLNATTKNLEFDTVRSEEDESINIHHAVPAKTADYETGLSHFGVDKGTDVSLSLQYLGKRETMGIDISQGGSKEAQMMGFSQIHDSGPHSHQNQRKTLFSDSVYSDPSQISIGRSPGFQTWGSQSKSKVIANPYESEYYEDALEGTDQSIESLMKRVDKNPIALLNELCTKVRLSIDYLFSVENTPRRMVFYCQVTINGRRFTNKAFGRVRTLPRGREQTRSENCSSSRNCQVLRAKPRIPQSDAQLAPQTRTQVCIWRGTCSEPSEATKPEVYFYCQLA